MLALTVPLGIIGLGVFCWLLYGAAIYALPFIVGVFVGFHSEQAGVGTVGAIALGFGTGLLTWAVGRTIFGQARSPFLRAAVATAFTAPAALAGYFTTFDLFRLTSVPNGWCQTFAVLGAVTVGAIAWLRLAPTPPDDDSNRRYSSPSRAQAARHHALDSRRRLLRRSF